MTSNIDMMEFMLRLARLSEAETLPRFRTQLSVENKESVSFDPVTEADRAAERVIRSCIQQSFPGDAIIGEEFDTTNADAADGWIIDPVDGTRAFISGVPLWGTLVGRYENSVLTAGLMHQPFIGESYIAANGESWWVREQDRQRLQTSGVKALGEAKLMTTSPRIFSPHHLAAYDAVEAKCKLPRYGGDCYAYALLAAGHIDVVMEADLKTYDIAALIPIIENAGGVVRTWDGSSAKDGGTVLAAATQTLWDETAAIIAAHL